ncbi:MAG TPA: NUDIX hydrolase, partial [Candidatus Limnocylindria bacterium]|nr:NUDIX hydrolase [Candidatus Limnocylindria bacterium]
MRRGLVLVVLAVLTLGASPRTTARLDLPRGYWGETETQPILDKTLELRLAPDLSGLSAGERLAVDRLISAGHIMNHLYELANHHQAPAAQRALATHARSRPSAQPLADLYWLFSGPIATTLDNERLPFLPVDSLVPGKNVYPWGVTKEEIEEHLRAHPEDRAAILNPRTVVRRAHVPELRGDLAALRKHSILRVFHPGLEPGLRARLSRPAANGFYAVPYAVAYADSLVRAYHLLFEAADLLESHDAELAGYFRHRARDLLANDYEAGDAAWVSGTFGRLNAQVGAYETYDDELFGTKAFHSMSILLEDERKSAELLAAIKNLQEFENSLPYAPHKKVRDRVSIGIYDVIADFGQARGTNTASILPNEAAIVRRYGRTILMRQNILMHPDLLANARDTWEAAVVPQHRADLQDDGSFYRVLWHEIGHYLGPDRDRRGRDLEIALQEESGTLEEMKADLVSLFLARSLRASGYYDERKLKGVYASGVGRVLLKSRPRRDQVYGVMQLMQLNWYLDKGSVAFDPATKKLRIRYDRYHDSVASLLREV